MFSLTILVGEREKERERDNEIYKIYKKSFKVIFFYNFKNSQLQL